MFQMSPSDPNIPFIRKTADIIKCSANVVKSSSYSQTFCRVVFCDVRHHQKPGCLKTQRSIENFRKCIISKFFFNIKRFDFIWFLVSHIIDPWFLSIFLFSGFWTLLILEIRHHHQCNGTIHHSNDFSWIISHYNCSNNIPGVIWHDNTMINIVYFIIYYSSSSFGR